MKISLSFPIYTPEQRVTLPTPIPSCYAIRVKQLLFRFNQFNKKVFRLSFLNLDSNHYFDGVNLFACTYLFFNDGSKSTINYFNNASAETDTYDSIFNNRYIDYVEIKVYIDNVLDTTINPQNPCYITVDFFSN